MCKMNASFSKVTLIVSAWTLVLIAGVRYRWGITNLAYLQMANERVRACSYGGEPARLPGWPGRRDSFHLVLIWTNSSPLTETEI